MTPERLLLAAMHSIIDTTYGDKMKKIGDYLETDQESFERFAWYPKRMSNNKRVWLKKYIEVRHYVDLFGRPPIKNNYYSAYFTSEDYLLYVLRGNPFKVDPGNEFTGTPEYHKAKAAMKSYWMMRE